jgi:hypothetical protein
MSRRIRNTERKPIWYNQYQDFPQIGKKHIEMALYELEETAWGR